MEIINFEHLLHVVKNRPVKRVVVVNGIDVNTLEGLNDAVELGLVSAILTGDKGKIEESCSKLGIDIRNYDVKHSTSEKEAAEKAVGLLSAGAADSIMKGLISTDKFMKVLLKKEYGLIPSNGMLSHVALMDNSNYKKLLLFSDSGVIPYPDLNQKVKMTRLLIHIAHQMGIDTPKVAIIAPTEQIIITIQSCMDAAAISKMAGVGQIKGGIVDGPMGLDVALSSEAASIKNYSSSVAGDANCLLFPNIDAANVFYKTNSKLCNAQMAGIIVGANVPAIVSSRGDSDKTKFNSILLASIAS